MRQRTTRAQYKYERKRQRDRQRKIHLRSVLYVNHRFAHCNIKRHGDITIHDDVGGLTVLDAAQLVWVPIEHQCAKCHRELLAYPGHGAPDVDYSTCDTHSATPLMLTTIEVVMHAWGAFCRAVDESGTHAERGHFIRLDDKGIPTCWCGVSSFLFSPLHTLWMHQDGDQILRELGWWAEHEWRNADGDEYITARVQRGERIQ